jgi:hypothetical protein
MTNRAHFISIAALGLAAASCGSEPRGELTGASGQALGVWNGDWLVVDSPNVGTQDNVLGGVSGSSANDVWAVGQYLPDARPTILQTLALHFDGSAWTVSPTPNVGSNANALLAVTAQPGAAWAAGYSVDSDFLATSLLETWDGTAWQITAHPDPFETSDFYGIASSSPTDVWAVGSGRDGQGAFHTLALHFDGRSWSVVPTVDPGSNGNVLYGVVALSPVDAWAVGQKIGDADPDQALIEHWDGVRWSEASAPRTADHSSQLLAVAAAGPGHVRAVGDAQDGVHSLRTLAESSDCGLFSIQATANPSTDDNRLAGVVSVSADETWSVGNFRDAKSGNQQTIILRGGEGGTWKQQPSPNPSPDGDNQLGGVSKAGPHDLWAVGAFDGPNAAQTLILHRCN